MVSSFAQHLERSDALPAEGRCGQRAPFLSRSAVGGRGSEAEDPSQRCQCLSDVIVVGHRPGSSQRTSQFQSQIAPRQQPGFETPMP
eukprot:CAMPEP_0113711500 /NCGR_PEP_ID=MMETSP0038_2-20120614/30800_1 /TAXON_ID=2898 /ORGANISM="Cryptomonas paramecium" /LENGTH=86 /DNA_ID=CAMNT_0000637781 /DNA_START=72 /DNA_END=332 /DNA_ORIENTATION=- /assembly_acc=CAM_ASM_000170